MAGAFKRERTLSIALRRSVMSTALITLTPAVTIGSVKTREKAAVTCVFTASTNVHDGVVALALHAPPQPPKITPASDVAVKASVDPMTYLKVQTAPQASPPVVLARVPVPDPSFPTGRA